MRELPIPYYPQWSHSNEHDAFTRDQVLAIQKQAYEDGLRDAKQVPVVRYGCHCLLWEFSFSVHELAVVGLAHA